MYLGHRILNFQYRRPPWKGPPSSLPILAILPISPRSNAHTASASPTRSARWPATSTPPSTRIATEQNEDYLLIIARHGTACHVETLVRCRSAACQRDCRGDKRHSCNEGDCLVLKGRLPPEQGALIVKALEMAMDKDFADVSAETSRGTFPEGSRSTDRKTRALTSRLPLKADAQNTGYLSTSQRNRTGSCLSRLPRTLPNVRPPSFDSSASTRAPPASNVHLIV